MESTHSPLATGQSPPPHPKDPTGEAEALVREPLQDRSRRTLRRIVEAGLHLLATQGPDALTVTGIVRRARTSVGSFYARFQGKDDLLRYLGERALEEAREGWSGVREEVALRTELREKVRVLVEGLRRLHAEGAGRDLMLLDGIEDPLPTRRDRLSSLLAADLVGLFEVTETEGELLTRILVAVLGDPQVRKRDALEPELAKLLSAYLSAPVSTGAVRPEKQEDDQPEHPEEPSPAEPDPFEVWG